MKMLKLVRPKRRLIMDFRVQHEVLGLYNVLRGRKAASYAGQLGCEVKAIASNLAFKLA